MAMGVSVVDSISMGNDGARYTRAVFDPTKGMAIEISDAPLTDALRAETGIQDTGTKVTIPIRRLADLKPHQYTFPKLMEQIENCVQIRPVLLDPHRVVLFEFGDAAPRRVRFQYARGESLIDDRPVEIGGFKGTLWAKVAKEPIAGSGWSRQTRRYGILIRGQRAAYEVSLGTKLQSAPVHKQLFGELRIDGIEGAQREADAKADEEAQLIYKADRSGLNPDHPLVELIYQYLDSILGPLLGALEANQRKKRVSEDVRRQLNQLARLINDAVKLEDFGEIESKTGRSTQDAQPSGQGPTPPEPPADMPDLVVDGMAFAYERIFVPAGKARAIKIWFNTEDIPPGLPVELQTDGSPALRTASVSAAVVPQPSSRGVAQLILNVVANEVEGRAELTLKSGGYSVSLPVHVRFPRATGFIREIVPVEEDWESGAAFYDPQTGFVRVYVGRPEFVDVAQRAQREKIPDPFQYTPYKVLVVESVREAALRTAAERRAEVLFDDLPPDERRDKDAFSRLVLTEYQALDYRLRRALVDSFVYG
jgi:hypothetical protein